MWTYAEAVDYDGRALERSVIQRTFIPSPNLVEFCNNRGCDAAEKTPDDNRVGYEAEVDVPERYLSTNRGFNTAHYYEDLPGSIARKTLQAGSVVAIVVAALVVLGVAIIVGLRSLGSSKPDEGSALPTWVTERAHELREGLGRTDLGSRVLGKYSRLEEKEPDDNLAGQRWRQG